MNWRKYLRAALRRGRPLKTQNPALTEIAQMIAEEIGLQCEIDNLGDCESIVFMESVPALNLVQLTEGLMERGIARL